MLEWECIGQYFNENTDVNNMYENKSFIELNGFGNLSFGDFLQSEDDSYLTYKIDNTRTSNSLLPSKITFKIRLNDYGHLNNILQFIDCFYIKYEVVNNAYSPCFVGSDSVNDYYAPFTDKLLAKEWCDVELFWHDGICDLTIDDIKLISTHTSNIISDNDKNIILRNDSFKVNFDIKDLCFYRLVKTDYQKPLIKIVKTQLEDKTKLTVKHSNYIEGSNTFEIGGFTLDSGMIFRIIFSNLKQGLRIPNSITIEGCTFKRDIITSYFTECTKVFTDNLTGKDITLKLYVYPKVEHNETNTELLSNEFHYYKNIDENDIFVADVEINQNGVNLSGRYITWNFNNTLDALITTHIVKKLQYGELEDGKPADLKINIIVHRIKGTGYPLITGIDFDGLTYKSKTQKDTYSFVNVFTINDSDDEIVAENKLQLISYKGDRIDLTANKTDNYTLWNYKDYKKRNDIGFKHSIIFTKGIKGAYDPILNMLTNISSIASMINFNLYIGYFTKTTIENIEVQLIAEYDGIENVISSCNYIKPNDDIFNSKTFYVDFNNSSITEIQDE